MNTEERSDAEAFASGQPAAPEDLDQLTSELQGESAFWWWPRSRWL